MFLDTQKKVFDLDALSSTTPIVAKKISIFEDAFNSFSSLKVSKFNLGINLVVIVFKNFLLKLFYIFLSRL